MVVLCKLPSPCCKKLSITLHPLSRLVILVCLHMGGKDMGSEVCAVVGASHTVVTKLRSHAIDLPGCDCVANKKPKNQRNSPGGYYGEQGNLVVK